MERIRRYKWLIIAGGTALALVAFLLFRPDKLFVDDVVDESLADAFTTTSTTLVSNAPENPATTTGPTNDTPTSGEVSTTTTQPAASEPEAIATGSWVGIDHSAVGTATVYEFDGEYILRFEDDTDIQNGPDLYVWVLPGTEFTGAIPDEYLDLGKIKGNVGGQNYELPDSFDPEVHGTVLVWCLRFSVPFAAASLA